MLLFLVTRWGHDDSEDGPNGEDTHFIIVANNHLEAAALADEALGQLPHERVSPWCSVVQQLGIDQSKASEPRIMLGPWRQFAFNGELYPNYWVRFYSDEEWTHAANIEL